MFTQPEALKQSQLINQLVLNRQTAEELGHVGQVLLDPQAHRVVGLTCKSGFLGGKKQIYSWNQVHAIGTDSILINTSHEGTVREQAENWQSPIGREVWTDAGNKVGKLVDYLLEAETGIVLNYLYSSSGWRGVMEGVYLLAPAAVSSVGSKRVIVLDKAVQNPQLYSGGLNKKIGQAAEFIQEDFIGQAAEFIQEDFKKTKEDLDSVGQEMQKAASQVKEKTQDVAEQVKDKAQAAGETVQKKVSQVRTPPQNDSQSAETDADK
ncbi:MAG: PRC-barrel domain-containing protein [Coleofasciculaceae cyanobacterium]